ncbi:MAG: hypothetical protein WBC93_14795 [Sulfitobacter sp.]
MLDLIFAIIAAAAQGVSGGGSNGVSTQAIVTDDPQAIENAQVAVDEQAPDVPGQTEASPPTEVPSLPSVNVSPSANVIIGGVTEPQIPTGKFTTATEVKPILSVTKDNWVAVREYDGKDLVYITHLWSWRCGLAAVSISINDEPMQNWPLPECHLDTAVPNAILGSDGLPYLTLRLHSVEKVTIGVTYDDLTTDSAVYLRQNVLLP